MANLCYNIFMSLKLVAEGTTFYGEILVEIIDLNTCRQKLYIQYYIKD